MLNPLNQIRIIAESPEQTSILATLFYSMASTSQPKKPRGRPKKHATTEAVAAAKKKNN
jgi:hypothetical protein